MLTFKFHWNTRQPFDTTGFRGFRKILQTYHIADACDISSRIKNCKSDTDTEHLRTSADNRIHEHVSSQKNCEYPNLYMAHQLDGTRFQVQLTL
jgi:hypothetical protein